MYYFPKMMWPKIIYVFDIHRYLHSIVIYRLHNFNQWQSLQILNLILYSDIFYKTVLHFNMGYVINLILSVSEKIKTLKKGYVLNNHTDFYFYWFNIYHKGRIVHVVLDNRLQRDELTHFVLCTFLHILHKRVSQEQGRCCICCIDLVECWIMLDQLSFHSSYRTSDQVPALNDKGNHPQVYHCKSQQSLLSPPFYCHSHGRTFLGLPHHNWCWNTSSLKYCYSPKM